MLKHIQRLLEGFKNLAFYCLIAGVFGAGLIMMVLGSLRLQDKELYVVLAVGGILMVSAFVMMAVHLARKHGKEEAQSEHNRESVEPVRAKLTQELDDAAKKISELVNKEKLLTRDLMEAKNKAVRTLFWRLCADLSLFEQECVITQCYDRYFDKNCQEVIDTEVKKGKGIKYRFLGALTAEFVAKYGFDIKRVEVKVEHAKKAIYFGGVEPSFRGFATPLCPQWECSVGLSHGFLSSWAIDENSLKLENYCKDKYQQEMASGLKKGSEPQEPIKKALLSSIRLLVKRCIAPLIAPPDYKIEFVEDIGEGSTPLLKYLGDRRLLGDSGQSLLP
jgi:hypothetical protein